jgi:hypothetical protein
MPFSKCKFIKRIAEFQDIRNREDIPNNTRGIYVLLSKIGRDKFDVVYIGMAAGNVGGMHGRLADHSIRKHRKWTHFTLFEVHDNITKAEIQELEGLILCIYRKDSRANKHNIQRRHKPLREVMKTKLSKWDAQNIKLKG